MPRARVTRPPARAARGTVVSITMLPGRMAGLICLSSPQWPSNGMVSTSRSAAAQAALFSSPETLALLPTAAWIFAAASRARPASRDPMITLSPARVQRRASPKPSGPVPPRTAIARGIMALTSSCELRLKRFFDRVVVRLQFEVDARVDRVALGRNASGLENQRLKFFSTGVLSGSGSGFTRDVFFHQRAAVIIRAGLQAELRQAPVQLYPGHLNIVDRARQHDPRQGMDFEVLGQSRPWPGNSLMKQQRILMHEAERNELGETSRLLLDVAQKPKLVNPVRGGFDMPIHQRG